MKKMENFLKRVLALALCLCMLMGDVGGALATSLLFGDTASLAVMLSDNNSASASLTYAGISKFNYNVAGGRNTEGMPNTNAQYAAYYVIDLAIEGTNVNKASMKFEHGLGGKNDCAVSFTLLEGNNATVALQGDHDLIVTGVNGALSGNYKILATVSFTNDNKLKEMMDNGKTFTSKLKELKLNDTNPGNAEAAVTVSAKPTVVVTSSVMFSDYGYGWMTSSTPKYIKWVIHYTNTGIRLSDTKLVATVTDGAFVTNKIDTNHQLSAKDHGVPIRGFETLSNGDKTITMEPLAAYQDAHAEVYDTDLEVVLYSTIPTDYLGNPTVDPATIGMTLTLTPENIATAITEEVSGKTEVNVTAQLKRSEYGAEPVDAAFESDPGLYVFHWDPNYSDNGATGHMFGYANDSDTALVQPLAFGEDGTLTAELAYNNYYDAVPVPYVTFSDSTSQKPGDAGVYGNGDVIKIDLNKDGVITEDEKLTIEMVGLKTINLISNRSPLEKTAEMAIVKGVPYIKWTVKLGGYTQIDKQVLTDTLSGNSQFAVSQDTPITITNVKKDGVQTISTLGNNESAGSTTTNLTLTLEQKKDYWEQTTSFEDRQITITYYSTVPEDTSVQNPVEGFKIYQDASAISNTAAFPGSTAVTVSPVDTLEYRIVKATTKNKADGSDIQLVNQNPTLYVGYVNTATQKVAAVSQLKKTGNAEMTGGLMYDSAAGDTLCLLLPVSVSNDTGGALNVSELNARAATKPVYTDGSTTYYMYDEQDILYLNADGNTSTGSTDFFQIVSKVDDDAAQTATFDLRNDKSIGLQGIDQAYRKGNVYVNTNENEFTSSNPIVPGGYGYRPSNAMGVAGNFHLVGFESVTMHNHVNGNVLTPYLKMCTGCGTVGCYDGCPGFGTNQLADKMEVSYVQTLDAGNRATLTASAPQGAANHLLVVGSNNNLGLINDNMKLEFSEYTVNGIDMEYPWNIMIDEDTANRPFINIAALKNSVTSYANDLSQVEDCGISMNLPSDPRTFTLISPDAAGFINLTAKEFSALPDSLKLMGFESGHRGSIVINVDCSGTDTVYTPGGINVYVDGKEASFNETGDFTYGRVIYNFVGAKNIVVDCSMQGIILAPGAKVTVTGSAAVNGSIIADVIDLYQETHRTDFQGIVRPGKGNFSAVKQVNGRKPKDNEVFTFYLQQLTKTDSGVTPAAPQTDADLDNPDFCIWDTAPNKGYDVDFESFPITEVGTYYFRVGEMVPAGDTTYNYSTEQYYIKIKSSIYTNYNNAAGPIDILNVEYKYYSDENFTNEIDGPHEFIFNNKTNDEVISISGSKTWNDGGDRESRPDSITIRLHKRVNGVETRDVRVITVTPDEDSYWKWIFEDLPEKENGTTIEYFITEDALPGYSTQINGYNVVNTPTNTNETQIPVEKKWANGVPSNINGVDVYLKRRVENGNVEHVGTINLNQGNQWKYTFKNDSNGNKLAAKNNEGKTYEYFIEEATPNGYTASYSTENGVLVVTNTPNQPTQEKISITVQKVWDNGNGNSNWTQNVQIELRRKTGGENGSNDQSVGTVELNSGYQQHTFSNLDKTDGNGNTYYYYAVETNVPSGYDVSYSNQNSSYITVKNTKKTQEKISITVQKVWDNGNGDTNWKQNVQIELRRKTGGVNGSNDQSVGTVELNSGYQQHTFGDLPKDDGNGNTYYYYAVETNVPDGYKVSYSNQNSSYITVTNKVDTGDKLVVTKIWKDNDPSKRPNSLGLKIHRTIDGQYDNTFPDIYNQYMYLNIKRENGQLIVDGDYTYTVLENSDNRWTIELTGYWGNRPFKSTSDDGKTYVYVVEENGGGGDYTAEYNPVSNNAYEITNTHKDYKDVTIDISGTKVWNDGNAADRPTTVTVQLYADGNAMDGKTATVTAGENGSWTFTFEGLEEGPVYTVEEVAVDGYSSVVTGDAENGYTITNTKVTDISVTKEWIDAADASHTAVSVQLKANGSNSGNPVELNSTNSWSYTWNDLPKYDASKNEIVYTVAEIAVNGYQSEVTGSETDGYTITNTKVTDISVTKEWIDAADASHTAVSVQLKANGSNSGNPVELNSTNSWSYTWNDLPKYDTSKNEIVYTVAEIAVNGYQSEVTGSETDGYTITNTKVTDISVTKEWIDAADASHTAVSVQLKANGSNSGNPVELNEDNSWSYTWNDLPKYDASKNEIVYTVAEIAVNGYQSEVTGSETDGFTITNTKLTDIPVEKKWEDNSNQDGLRPASVTVALYESVNGSTAAPTGKTAELNEGNSWKASFDDLPAYKTVDGANVPVVYSVVETSVPTGYTATNGTADNNYTVTNTHTPETINLNGEKKWVGDEDQKIQAIARPDAITIKIFKNGSELKTITVTAANDWKWTENNLPKYENGVEITYTVEEVAITGYDASVSGYDVTNTLTTVNFEGSKSWVDEGNEDCRPASITVNAVVGSTVVATTTATSANNWAWSFTGLPKCDKTGADINYTFTEEAVPGYTATVVGTAITNTLETVEVKGTKVWDDESNKEGFRPGEITVNLYKTVGEGAAELVESKPVTGIGDTWSWEFTNLPKYDGETEILYTVTENEVANYDELVITGNMKDGYTITNGRDVETVDIPVTKIWDDNGDAEGLRPDSITVRLFKVTTEEVDGVAQEKREQLQVVSISAAADDSWSHTFTGLQKYENGVAIVYDVTEDQVANYKIPGVAINGYVVTIENSRTKEYTELTGKKVWEDNNDALGMRPAEIKIDLYKTVGDADRVFVKTETFTGTGNEWTWAFTGLDKYEDGELIVYTAEEQPVDHYTTTSNGTTITNTYKNETVDISGKKVWEDESNKEGFRPASVTVDLYETIGTNARAYVKSTTASGTTDEWSWSFEDLPKYKNGYKVVYTVDETTVPNYQTPAITGTMEDGYTITNGRIVEPVEIPVTKIWEDNGNVEGFRPDSINVTLYKVTVDENNAEVLTKVGDTVSIVPDNDGQWSYTFTNLLKYENGQLVDYRVVEDQVPNYDEPDVVENGYAVTITNGREEDFTQVSGTKIWNDNSNQDGKRPASLELVLFANNEQYKTETFNGESNEWSWSFTNLPKYRNGTEVVYTVSEVLKDADGNDLSWVADYETEADGFTFTNTHQPEKIDISGSKTWNDDGNRDNLRPASIVINLLADGEVVATKTVTGSDWSWSFTNLPKYANGEEIEYTIAEVAVDDYTTEVNGYNVINTHAPEETSVSVTKVWLDGNDQDDIRPTDIQVQLKANGSPYGDAVTLNEGNSWAYAWTKLPKNQNGVAIVYTVDEVDVPDDYDKTVTGEQATGYIITNTHTPEVVEVPVTKVWDDADNQDGYRPTSITYELWQTIDGVKGETAYQTIERTADTGWNYTFTNLPKFADGIEILYSVTETVTASEYKEPAITGNMTDGFTVVNEHEVEKTEITATKVWDDSSNQDGKRPTTITFHLYANGEKVEGQSQTVTAVTDADSQTITWTGLDKKANGVAIVYTVDEEVTADLSGAGYTKTKDGNTITNSYETEEVEVSVHKVWDDTNDQDGKRPDTLDVNLLAGGEVIDTATLNSQNSWSASWDELPKYEAGTQITYTVEEVLTDDEGDLDWVTDYTCGTAQLKSAADNKYSYEITNSHETEKVEVSGSKTWNDENNHDGFRPDSIEITLKADGNVVETKTVTEEDGWKWSWTGLDKYKNGTEITYTVTEAAVARYTTEYDGYNVTNSYTPGKTNVSGTKTWNDEGNQDGLRPESITINLLANGKETGKTAEVTVANGWSWNFTDLDKYQNGEEIVYTITEEAVPGYTTEVNGSDVTNTHTPAETSVSVEKVWSDSDDQDGMQPDSIKVQLYANGTAVGEAITLNDDNHWAYTWTELPVNAAGTAIVYSVDEVAVPAGYTRVVSGNQTTGFVITNSHDTEETEITVTKEWQDNNNQDGIRATEIDVTLLADGEAVETVTLNNDNLWTYTWSGLDKYADGEEIEYMVDETEVPAGYSKSIEGDAETGYTIVNTHTPETVDVSGSKTWNDDNDHDGFRPASIEITLKADGEVVETVEVTEEDGWKWSWTGLDKYKNGTEISYTVVETPVERYTTTYSGYNVINSYTPGKTNVSGTKKWEDESNQDGLRPESITINLLANGKETGKTAEVTAANGWTWNFTDLDEYKDGEKIVYTITEEPVPGYTTEVDGYDVTNTHTPAETSVSVEKVWSDSDDQDGMQPDSIKVQLYANGTAVGEAITLNDDNHWAYTWTELPVNAAGTAIVYSVDEVAVPEGYTRVVSGNQTTGFVITNSHDTEETEITVTKEWQDNNNQDGIRATEIDVTLLADGEAVETVTLNNDNLWTYTWSGLDKYADGEEIEYTVDETNVPAGYSKSIEGDAETGYTIVNTHTPETVDVSGSKTWNDDKDHDGFRPDSIEITLKADGEVVETVEVTEEDGWKWSWTGLDKFNNGTEIVYTITETPVDRYSTEVNGYDVTNSYTPGKTTVAGSKTWSDSFDQDGIRPTKIEVKLMANGVQVDSLFVTAEEDWKWEFKDVDRYANGKEIEYTVIEVPVEGYEADPDGYDLNNIHYTEETKVMVTKIWSDNNDQDGKRPESIMVQLYADGTATGEPVKLNEDNTWFYLWMKLPKKSGGKVITYTVDEVNVPEGYEKTIADPLVDDSGTTCEITNTHTPEVVEIHGVKTWNDDSDRDDVRPDSITITLFRQVGEGEKTELNTIEVTGTTNDWSWSFGELPVYEGGQKITYTIEETGVPEGYTSVTTGSNAAGYTITNTRAPETIDINGVKVWDDNNNQDGKRTTAVTIKLLADGTEIDRTTATADSNWAWSFTDLPKFKTGAVGQEIAYSVTEIKVTGYDEPVITGSVEDGFTVTNKHEPEVTSVSGSKTWNDKNDQDGKRPESIEIKLLANGQVYDTKTVTEADEWSWKWENLPVYQAGIKQTYTIEEITVEGYTTNVSGYDVINSTDTETTFVKVTKVWDDKDDQDGIRPDSIKVQLKADNDAKVDEITLSESNNWTYTWSDLDKKANGVDIVYTVDEVEVPAGYAKTITGSTVNFVITNAYTPEETGLNGTKVWDDADDQDGIRPESVTVKLLADGVDTGRTATASEDNGWIWSFTGLPKKADGTTIVYTVKEVVPAGYECSQTVNTDGSITLTNTHTPAATELEGVKVWEDNDDQDGIRPDSITVKLLADGKETGKTAEASEATGWSWSFTELDKFANGEEIEYTIDEITVDGYDVVITGDAEGGYTITNTHQPEKISLEGVKVWEDNDDQDGIRPDSITVKLLADGKETGKTAEASEATGWSWSFTELDKFANGEEIEYTIEEITVDGYDVVITGDAEGGYTITNTHQPEKTEISGTKVWEDNNNRDGKRPTSITITLLADGEETGMTAEASEATGWSWSFTELDKFADGEEIEYTIEEITVDGYDVDITGDAEGGYTITNTHAPDTTSVSGGKTWLDNDDQDGKRPDSITIRLYADGTEVASKTVTSGDNWSWEFTNLPKYRTDAVGEEIVYTVSEDAVAEYTTEPDGYNFINTHTPEKIDLEGSKTWNDADNQDGKRPESITVSLLANGQPVAQKTVTADDEWKWSFTGLDKYQGGEEITYTVAEAVVPGYTVEADGMDLTNSYTPGKTQLSGSKVWDDNNDQDGKRPENITIRLMKQVGNTEAVATGDTITLTEKTGWTWSFKDLDEYEDGVSVVYSVTEDAVDGYETTIVTGEDGNVTITNSYEPELLDVEGSKIWQDNKNQDGVRPTRITVRLFADGEEEDNVTVGHEQGWSWSFTDLPMYRDHGVEIVYTVEEDPVDGYTASVEDYDIINSHVPAETNVMVTKEWLDADDQDGIRPEGVTVQLMADGVALGDAVTLNEANEWTWAWTKLPMYRDMGTAIIYTVEETEVPEGYTAETEQVETEDGSFSYIITNTHEPEQTGISGSKTWVDADNQDGIRPESIIINLLADGEETGKTAVVTEADDWKWSFTGLDKFKAGVEIVYTFEEEVVEGYQTTYSDDTTAVTNTHETETVDVEGTKTWNDNDDQDGKRPESITIRLLADGTEVQSKTVTEADGWKWSFTDLDKFDDGKEIVYTITEDAVEGYTTDVNDYDVTNSYTPGKVKVEGKKTWIDNNDQDGKRPESITIRLLADGVEVDHKTVTIGDNNWSWSFVNLDEYKDGKKIVYTIAEDAVEDYTTEITGYNVTNSYVPETKDIEGTKTWADADDQDGIRPEAITIRLWADGVNTKTVIVNAETGWNWSFTGLPVYRDHGTEIAYAITEDAVEGYTAQVNGYDVTNTHKPAEVEVSGAKTWVDADDQDGMRPESITIRLLADGVEVDHKTVTAEDDWKWSFTNLPKFEGGVEIVYTITEDAVAEYETKISGFSAINTHETETVDVEGSKIWNDANDQDGKRPAYIKINLLANGKKIDSKTVTAEDDWKWSWTGLDKYEDGEEINYTITEEAVAAYETKVSGYNVTNTHTPETVSVEGSKTWNDANDQDGKRPESITINLLANNVEIDEVVITPDEEGNWPGWSFTDLPKYEGGKEISYTVTEDAVEGYNTVVKGYSIENSYTPGKTQLSGVKVWVDDNNRDAIRPESITILLNKTVAGVTTEGVASKTVTEADDWKWSFDELPEYENGQLITYSFTEEVVTGYVTAYSDDTTTITNTHTIETTDVAGTKTWKDADDQDGIRPESITIRLMANGNAALDSESNPIVAVVTEADGWAWSFTDLPKNDAGVEIVYTVVEDEVEGYTTTVEGFNVTNTHTPETVSVEGAKTWDDADNQDGKRPERITINLLANGEAIDSVKVKASDNWSWSFTDLPKFKAGVEIVYTITEEAVAAYETEVSGYNVTNTHTPETVSVEGSKTWNDANDQDGKRPESITINLLADGEQIDTKIVKASDNWSWSFTELPKYKAGKEISYTVTEDAVEGYTTEISGYNVTNTHEPELIDVEGAKVWDDSSNQDGKRPESIVINLLADGQIIKTVTVTKADWSWSFTDLPKFKAGVEIVYTITEEAVAEYETEVNGYDVTNTHVPEVVEVEGTKTWNDADDQDGIRPESITINLLADGEQIDTKTVKASDNWSWSFTELPKYKAGKEISYTVTEDAVEGYAAETEQVETEDGSFSYLITNTHEPELIDVVGAKTWDDADNQDGKRPASIIINLLANGEAIDSVKVKASDNWSWSFTDLPKFKAGVEIVYTITEEAVAAYETEVSGYNVTNTHTPETVSVEGTKTWVDVNDKHDTRPESITIRLLADGEEIATKTVSKTDGWKWNFTGLPKYKAGVEIVYTITEDAVEGYNTVVDGYDVTNTLRLVEFIKLDRQTGKRLSGATFALYEGKVGEYDETSPVETWVSDKNAKVLTGLKVGQTYTIVEIEAPDGYARMAPFQFTMEAGDVPGTYRSFTMNNDHVYRFRKLDSKTNGLVYNALMAVKLGNTVIESWYTDGTNEGWHNMVSSQFVAGKTYTLVELEAPAGYELADPITFTIDKNDGMIVVGGRKTNKAELVMYDEPSPEATPTPEPKTTSITVTKRWDDKDNVLGLRPTSITLNLFRKLRTDADYPATPFMTVQMNSNGKDVWKFTFKDLPRRSPEGVLYEYTVREVEVEGYVVTYQNNGQTIINAIPEEDYPPTPTPTLPYVTPTPSPVTRVPTGVQFVDGEWVYVDEYGIPLGGIPLTGDNTNFILWGMAIGLPLLVAALAAVEIRRRKKLLLAVGEDEDEEDEE